MEKFVFSEQEKLFLVQLVTNEKDILENKKTDGSTLKLKNEVWEKITSIFNSHGFSKRSSKQLRKCWENIKQRKRKLNTSIRQHQLMTGGGPSIKIKDDPVMDFVDGAAPNLDIEISCPWDSTAVYEEKSSTNTNISAASTSIVETASTSNVSGSAMHEQNQISTPSTSTARTIMVSSQLASTSTKPPSTLSIKKRRLMHLDIDSCDERELRVKKIKESLLQQRELHESRMRTAKMEHLLAVLKVKQQLNQMGEELNVDEIDFDTFDPKELL